jgi:hypothetical protein
VTGSDLDQAKTTHRCLVTPGTGIHDPDDEMNDDEPASTERQQEASTPRTLSIQEATP